MTSIVPAVPTVPRHAYRRGTRGFAAFVTGLADWSSSGWARSCCPSPRWIGWRCRGSSRSPSGSGWRHLVAAYGLVRRRAWSRDLVGYLAAIGIGLAAYRLILMLTGQDPFGATSRTPSDRAWAGAFGLLLWMIGLWVVAARYAFKGIVLVGRSRQVGRPWLRRRPDLAGRARNS